MGRINWLCSLFLLVIPGRYFLFRLWPSPKPRLMEGDETRKTGIIWLIVFASLYLYITFWLFVLPFIPRDQVIHDYFLSEDVVFCFFSVCGLSLILGVGTFIGLALAGFTNY